MIRKWLINIEAIALVVVSCCAAGDAPDLRASRLETKNAGQANQGSTVGATRKNSQDGLIYVWIPPGSFMMGCPAGDRECFKEQTPAHRVTLTKGFWFGQTEVTIEAYARFAGIRGDSGGDTPDTSPQSPRNVGNKGAMPVVDVTWGGARDYCRWAAGRLPTEAEWEYAARGGTAQARYGSIDEIAWYGKNSEGAAHEVSRKLANGFGLYDVLGNAWEWVNDWYDGEYYSRGPEFDPTRS